MMTTRRERIAERLLARLDRHSRALEDAAFTRPTLVCAPHPDDETLGCGGTIALLRARQTPVTVAVISRGDRSHSHLMDADRLAATRADEVRAACTVLGVEDLQLLGLPDGGIEADSAAATERLTALIESRRPQQILVPFRSDLVPDHRATRDAALDAVRRVGRPIDVLEYPVWFWTLVPTRRRVRYGLRGRLNRLLDAGVPGIPIELEALDTYVELGDALSRKRAALAEHRSQTTRLVDDERWLTLSDVEDGHLLRMTLAPRERFHCWRLTP